MSPMFLCVVNRFASVTVLVNSSSSSGNDAGRLNASLRIESTANLNSGAPAAEKAYDTRPLLRLRIACSPERAQMVSPSSANLSNVDPLVILDPTGSSSNAFCPT